MGLNSGSLTFFRLKFDEKIRPSVSEVADLLQEWSFDKIYNDDNMINYGFVPLGYPENNNFASSEICFEQTYMFAMRFDEKRLNKKFFEIELAEKKKEFILQSGKNKLTKSDMDFIKNGLLLTMSKQTLPVTSILEIIFKPEKNVIYISGISNKIFDAVEHLFKGSFDIIVYRDSIVNTAKSVLQNPGDVDELINVSPTSF